MFQGKTLLYLAFPVPTETDGEVRGELYPFYNAEISRVIAGSLLSVNGSQKHNLGPLSRIQPGYRPGNNPGYLFGYKQGPKPDPTWNHPKSRVRPGFLM